MNKREPGAMYVQSKFACYVCRSPCFLQVEHRVGLEPDSPIMCPVIRHNPSKWEESK